MKIVLFVSLLYAGLLYGQSKDIRIDTVRDNDTIIFFASNNSAYEQDVTVAITKAQGLDGFMQPLTVRLQPNTTDVYHKLVINKEDFDFDFDYANSFPSEKLIQKNFNVDGVTINQGIVVFEKDECSRCMATIAFLKKNNISHQVLNISANTFYNQLMWELLSLNGVYEIKVQTPIILVDGEISHSHKDLMAFLKQIASRN